jgi:RNA polymerase sigma factor (sigma-70 family)
MLNERELIKGCIEDDIKCQHLLFETYAGRLLTICRRYAADNSEAEDVLQEALVKIYNNLNQFRFECPLEGWMRRIVVNTAIRACKKKKIHFREIHENVLDGQSFHPAIYGELGEEEILKIINQLPEGYKMVFNLYVIDGYSHEEIATMLGIQEGTSRSQLAKARRLLQKLIYERNKVMVA